MFGCNGQFSQVGIVSRLAFCNLRYHFRLQRAVLTSGDCKFGSTTVGDAILCRVVFYELDQTIHGTALQDRTMQGVAKRGEARQGYILRRH